VSKYNPKKIDYNKDGAVDSKDDIFGVKDYDGDGKVTQKEEGRFKQEREETKTEYKYNAKGELVESTVKGSAVEVPEPGINLSEYTERFLKGKDDVRRALFLARKYNWDQDQFNSYIETQTAWGKATTEAQAAFDLQIKGSKREEFMNPETGKIPVKQREIQQMLTEAGITVPETEVAKFAREAVRSGLDENAVRSWVANKFSIPTGPTAPTGPQAPTGPAGAALQGTSSSIADALKRMARSYGVTLTDETLQIKIREALAQGDNWLGYVEGQRNVFRQNAKTLYPSARDDLDNFTLEELLDPYLEDASALLGVQRKNMDISNPMWTRALNNADGSPMTREQWMTTLRTDKQYGWNKTQKAKTEYAELGDELLRVFGMA
jgi:hypothetical protein